MAPLKRLLLSLATLYRITTASDPPHTISALPAYSQQRQCATNCFFLSGQDILGSSIECCEQYTDNDCIGPVAEPCYCRADLRPSAVSWLSFCVDERCSTNAVDLSSAVAVYDGYCGAAAVTQPSPTRTVGGADAEGGSTVVSATTIIMTQSVKSDARIRIQGVSGLSLVAVVVLTMILQRAITG